MALTPDEMKESLIFYRRRLTERIAVELVRCDHEIDPAIVEDLANAITERLEARETGVVHGYGLKSDPKE